MDIRPHDERDLPGELEKQVLNLAQQMWQAIMADGCSPAQAEERVVELSRTVGREVLSEGLSERYGKQQGRYRACPCGEQQRFEGYRARQVMTMLGAVTYRRAYYRCASCKATHYAGEEALGLEGSSFSLPAQEAIALVSSELPFQRTRVLLGRLNGIAVSISHAENVSRVHGERIQEALSREREQLFEGDLSYLPSEREHRLYVTLDATKTRFRDDWHETRVGAVYNVKPGRDRLDEPDRTTYVAMTAAAGLEDFGRSLYQEAARRGVDHAAQVVVVADGAPDPASVVPAGVTGRALPPTSTLAFTGDVLFAGSIGRMDLPGGDEDAMIRTLASLVAVLPRDAWVLPGHGPSSTMSGEAARNPYLSAAFLDARRSAPGTY